MDPAHEVAAKGGRPRSAAADQAILDATTRLLIEGGFRRLSVDAVATRAGVGKATIYRRWRSKSELLRATLARVEETPEFVDSRNLRSDLQALLRWLVEHFVDSDAADLMPLLVTESRFDPDLRDLRNSVSQQGRDVVRQILDRARSRGELADDLDLEVVIDMLIAPIFIRRLITGAPITTHDTDAAVDLLLHGIRQDPRASATCGPV
jgi:AcrR family transcriptional regulator